MRKIKHLKESLSIKLIKSHIRLDIRNCGIKLSNVNKKKHNYPRQHTMSRKCFYDVF